jgi:IS30 family transposase
MFQRTASGHLSLQQKGSIIALHQRNVTFVDITQEVGCHRKTVTK